MASLFDMLTKKIDCIFLPKFKLNSISVLSQTNFPQGWHTETSRILNKVHYYFSVFFPSTHFVSIEVLFANLLLEGRFICKIAIMFISNC